MASPLSFLRSNSTLRLLAKLHMDAPSEKTFDLPVLVLVVLDPSTNDPMVSNYLMIYAAT